MLSPYCSLAMVINDYVFIAYFLAFLRCVEVFCLQEVLCKKRDAVSHNTFAEILNSAKAANVIDAFWKGAVNALSKVSKNTMVGISNVLQVVSNAIIVLEK